MLTLNPLLDARDTLTRIERTLAPSLSLVRAQTLTHMPLFTPSINAYRPNNVPTHEPPTRTLTHIEKHIHIHVFSHWTHVYSQGNKLNCKNLLSQHPFVCVCVNPCAPMNVFVCISIDHDCINSLLLCPDMAFRRTAQSASPKSQTSIERLSPHLSLHTHTHMHPYKPNKTNKK